MTVLIHGMIIFGIIIMVTNIARYIRFIMGSKDVLSSGDKKDRAWEYVALMLLIFFLVGYILVTVIGKPDIIIAGILFGGSIFVAIVLTLMFRLISTVKENSLNIAETLISVVDARDPNLRGHSRYVQNVTMAIYDHLPPAKIIAVADTYSAITMRRSYKPPRTYEEAVSIMKEAAGTQLDAELVEIFLKIPKEPFPLRSDDGFPAYMIQPQHSIISLHHHFSRYILSPIFPDALQESFSPLQKQNASFGMTEIS